MGMGNITSSAALLGYEDPIEQEHAIATELQTPDLSDANLKPFSLSTIQEERTSQMMSPEAQATQQSETLINPTDSHDPVSISVGKVDEIGDVSISIGNQELTLSLYQTPDLSENDDKNICEMFADELAESITESKYVELPPLRFMKETAKATNINMEAVIIDIDQQGLEEYESLRNALENVDDLKTEADIDDVSIADLNDEPDNIREFEALTCEEIFELDETSKENVMATKTEASEGIAQSNLDKETKTKLEQTEDMKMSSDTNAKIANIKQDVDQSIKEAPQRGASSSAKPASHSTGGIESNKGTVKKSGVEKVDINIDIEAEPKKQQEMEEKPTEAKQQLHMHEKKVNDLSGFDLKEKQNDQYILEKNYTEIDLETKCTITEGEAVLEKGNMGESMQELKNEKLKEGKQKAVEETKLSAHEQEMLLERNIDLCQTIEVDKNDASVLEENTIEQKSESLTEKQQEIKEKAAAAKQLKQEISNSDLTNLSQQTDVKLKGIIDSEESNITSKVDNSKETMADDMEVKTNIEENDTFITEQK